MPNKPWWMGAILLIHPHPDHLSSRILWGGKRERLDKVPWKPQCICFSISSSMGLVWDTEPCILCWAIPGKVQGSLLERLGRPYEVLGTKSRWIACKISALLIVLYFWVLSYSSGPLPAFEGKVTNFISFQTSWTCFSVLFLDISDESVQTV